MWDDIKNVVLFLCGGMTDETDDIEDKRCLAGKDTTSQTSENEQKMNYSCHQNNHHCHQENDAISPDSDDIVATENCCYKCTQCLGICCMVTCAISRTICPPFPNSVIRKVAFRPPTKGESYKILVKDLRNNYFEIQDTREALAYSKIYIQPIMPKMKNLEKYLQSEIKNTQGFVIKSKSGNYIVCSVFEPLFGTQLISREYVHKVVLFAQPNSSDIGNFMLPFFPACFPNLCNTIGVRFYAFDYSGYGRSTGTPSEQNIYDDIESVYEEIIQKEGSHVQIILLGYSIGTTAVINLASKNHKNIAGVVLVAPFTSGWRLLKNNPRMEKTICMDCFLSYEKIQKINKPIFICHGTNDAVVPLTHGEVLYERSKMKVNPLVVEGASHQSIFDKHTQIEIRYFISIVDKYKEFTRDGKPLNIRKAYGFVYH